jgi:signal transduction histidine kinase
MPAATCFAASHLGAFALIFPRVKRMVVLLLGALPVLAQTPEPARPLTTAREVRFLAPTNAASQLPVKLRGVVTAADWRRTVFLQDETGGSFFGANPAGLALQPGHWIEVAGVTYQGLFVPGLRATNVTILGRRELPAPVTATYDDLLSGRLHYQRVEVVGVVRAVELAETNTWAITLAQGARRLEVRLRPADEIAPPTLVDARVRVAGLAAGFINDKRQLVAPQVFLNDPADIRIEQPPPIDPFTAPLLTVAGLLNFNPEGASPHRVRVRGVVTHQRAGEALFLRDEGRGLFVRTRQTEAVRPGEVVEAVGFPAMGTFSALLEDAEFRRAGSDPEPQPVMTTVAEALKGANDADLVALEAQLIEVLETPSESVLLLRADDTAFHARLPRTALGLRGGARLRLTGVCRVEESIGSPGFRANPRTIELLLRAPADITVLAAPSWWTAGRLAVAALLLLALALGALAWAAQLRRRVAEQTEVIRRKIEREAMLEERQRLAREMHDTLAQSFSGVGFQLEALDAKLPSDEGLKQTLATAKQLVRHGQEEFRRSLMNLRAQELERGGLAAALAELGRQITTGTAIVFEFTERGAARRLPEAVENNLLRIGQECLTNAVRHAKPGLVCARLEHDAGTVRLTVSDDGAGFDPAALDGARDGHFGWRGIRERAEQIGAQMELDSAPGKGTTVTVLLPIRN